MSYRDYGFADAGPAHTMAYLLPVIKSLAGEVAGKRVLDVGCGSGFLANWLRRQGAARVVGIDLSETGIRSAREAYPEIRFEILPADDQVIERLGEPPFDLVVSTEVIEHLYDPRSFVRGCHAACAAGGSFVCSTPYHGYLKYLALALAGKMDEHVGALWDGGHIKFFSFRTITALLHECGFRNVRCAGAGRVPYLWKSLVVLGAR